MKFTNIVTFAAVLAVGIGVGYSLRGKSPAPTTAHESESGYWTCPMHPSVVRPEFGQCPICGMDLILADPDDLGPRRIALSDEAIALAEVATALVERRAVAKRVRLVGKVDYDETRVKTIAAWIPSGRIDRQFVDYTGVPVQQGEHLVVVYSPELLTAQQELLEAHKAVAQNADELSEFLRESDRRRLESARDKLRLWGLTNEQVAEIEQRGTAEDRVMITSPSSGIVIHKGVNEGGYVQTGTPIYRIADLDHLWVRLDAYESDLQWIRYGQTVSLETEAYPGQPIEGRITFVAPTLDERTRTVAVRVNVDNHDRRLKPGMFVRAIVEANLADGGRVMDVSLAGKWVCPMHPEVIEDEAGACPVCGMDTVAAEQLGFVRASDGGEDPLVVPATAVLITGKRGIVYVEHREDGRIVYEGREVVVGPRAGEHYVVLSGLAVGERVVVNGNFKIDSALQLGRDKESMMTLDPGPIEGPEMAPFRRALAPMFGAYFDAQEALAADDPDRARPALTALAAAVAIGDVVPERARGAWRALAGDLERHAERAAAAVAVEDVRAAFRDLSIAMIEVQRSFGHTGTTAHYEVHCPMAFSAGASWLQRHEEIDNPYYGAAMLRCGTNEQTFDSIPSADRERR